MLTFGLMKFRGQDILRTVLVFIAVLSLCLQSNCAVPKPDEGTQCNDSFCPLDPTESSRFCRFSEIYPRNYIAYKTKNPPIIDGVLNDEAWEQVEWSDLFVDILGNSAQTPRFETRMKMRWDSNFLYIAAALQEPDIWANLTQHNSVIFHDNDFEVFVDPAGSTHFYKEFEINANNATWDLCLNRPYLNGGYENSSRTFPAAGWDMPAARSAVHVDGEINRPGPPGRQWTVELALPVADLVYNNTARRPKPGWLWRINFSRVEWHVVYTGDHYEKVPGAAEDNWVWAPTGAVNMHLPERWGYLQFAGPAVNASRPRRDPFWTLRVGARP